MFDPVATCRPVLVVDDNFGDASLIKYALQEIGCEDLSWVEDGAAALEALERLPDAGLPALVLLDYNMPVLAGLETLVAIRSHPREALRRLPVVLYSGSPREREKCLAAGASEYVIKPTVFTELMKVATRLRDQYLLAGS